MSGLELRTVILRTCDGLSAMVGGALLLAFFLEGRTPPVDLGWTTSGLLLTLCALGAVQAYARPVQDPVSTFEPSARWSGAAVVVITGIVAAFAFSAGLTGSDRWFVAGGISLLTLLAAAVLWRFAKLNEGQIGEARFRRMSSQDDA